LGMGDPFQRQLFVILRKPVSPTSVFVLRDLMHPS
jgi:hypothetical protein